MKFGLRILEFSLVLALVAGGPYVGLAPDDNHPVDCHRDSFVSMSCSGEPTRLYVDYDANPHLYASPAWRQRRVTPYDNSARVEAVPSSGHSDAPTPYLEFNGPSCVDVMSRSAEKSAGKPVAVRAKD